MSEIFNEKEVQDFFNKFYRPEPINTRLEWQSQTRAKALAAFDRAMLMHNPQDKKLVGFPANATDKKKRNRLWDLATASAAAVVLAGGFLIAKNSPFLTNGAGDNLTSSVASNSPVEGPAINIGNNIYPAGAFAGGMSYISSSKDDNMPVPVSYDPNCQ